jgi:hypothetical protein
MAKLVKMTSSAGLSQNSNSFTVRSDDDIIIAPNSSVALLNGFISSGIVADYNIKDQNQSNVLGDLFLVANPTTTPDRARQVILNPGEYGVSPMLNEMSDAFNRSLIYRSLPQTSGVAPDSFNTPPELDFGLEVGCSLNGNNQITIKYNSAAQKITADLDYTNKDNGVNVAANGDISYTTPGGTAAISLDAGSADDQFREIYTTTDPTTYFAIGDVVNLSSADGRNIFPNAQITDIQLDSVSTSFGIALDPTVADTTNDFVYSLKDDYLVLPPGVPPFAPGQDITMDDGAGVAGTASANTIYGRVDIQPVLFSLNPNVAITESHAINGFVLNNPINITNPIEVAPDTQYTITIDVPFNDVDLFHILDDAIFYITNNTDVIVAVAQITAVRGVMGGATTTIDIDTRPFDTVNINIADFTQLNTIEKYTSLPAQSQDVVASAGDIVGVYEGQNLLYMFEVDGIVQASGNDDLLVTAAEGSLITLTADETTVLTGLAAMESILTVLFGANPTNLNNIQLICMSKILTRDPVDKTANFKDGDDVVFGENAGPLTTTLSADSSLFSLNGANYTLFQLAIDPTQPDEYKFKRDLMLQVFNTPIMYKDTNGKRIQIHLISLDPDNTKFDLMTRIWAGEDITNTYIITLFYPNQAAGFTLRNYSLMVKGLLRPTQSAYVVEDTRLNHACGRVAFLVVNAGFCEFGMIPESANFAGQSISSNDIKVAIEPGNVFNTVYKLYRGQIPVDLKTELKAETGDRVIIEWGVSSPLNGREYISTINTGTNPGVLTLNDSAPILIGDVDQDDSRKILVSVLRNTTSTNFFYLGCPLSNPSTANVNDVALCQTTPWTPRASPYILPQYWNNDADLHVYVNPNQGTVRILELSPTPMITFDGTSYTEFDGTHSLLHTTLHAISDPAQIDQPHKLKSFANVFNFQFDNIDLQRRFGYKIATNILNGAAGSWSAEKSYLAAYLPENLTILLDTLSNVQSYDLEQNGGRRRSIIGTVVNSQQSIGEIYIEPNNLYHIKLGNKEPINLRRFVVSLEDFYGTPLLLQSARAVINLLFTEGTS